jgi:hypothetical protein
LNGGGLDHWTIGLSIVNARLLVKTLGNKSGFVAINGSISFAFETKNPFAANDVGIGGGGNKGPGTVTEERIKFCVHCCTSSRMLSSR